MLGLVIQIGAMPPGSQGNDFVSVVCPLEADQN
jgi:hypothetical protein